MAAMTRISDRITGDIDRQQRDKLSQDLRRLVTGRMTNDEFDEAYFDEYESSPDTAVREIATFGYGLYSSDVLMPYRLKGRHRVPDDVRQAACRCMLFLRSDRPYEWPPLPAETGSRLLQSLSFSLGLPGSIALLIIAAALLLAGDAPFATSLAIPAAALLVVSGWVLFRSDSTPQRQAWRDSGDFKVWPFLRVEDFDVARAGNSPDRDATSGAAT